MDFSPTLSATASPAVQRDLARLLSVLGWIGIVGGLLGALQAVAVLATPAMVSSDRYSYPLDATWYVAAQISFALQHVTLLALVAGLAVLGRRTRSRLIGIGLTVTGLGVIGLIACELFALSAASATTTSVVAGRVNDSYGVPMIIMGVGLVLAGVGVATARVLTGASRWLPLALGIYVFVVLFPAVFGPQVAGRLAIGVWMLLFAALGVVLLKAGRMRRVGQVR